MKKSFDNDKCEGLGDEEKLGLQEKLSLKMPTGTRDRSKNFELESPSNVSGREGNDHKPRGGESKKEIIKDNSDKSI